MATALQVKKATPFSLVYAMTGDGAKGTIPGSAFVGDCVAGPLKALLKKLYGNNAMASLNLDADRSAKVRIRHVEGISTAQVGPTTRTINWVATGLEVTAGAASVSEIEIRLAHSNAR